jgi:hypothetical protein
VKTWPAAAEMQTARVESASDRSPQSSASPLIPLQTTNSALKSSDDELSAPLTASDGGGSVIRRPPSDAWRINASDITIGKQLSSGAFGVVWRGSWHHKRITVKQLKAR